jgi:hypothetical protein
MPNGSATEHDVWTAINDIRESVAQISVNTATLVRADADREKVCIWHAKDIDDLKKTAIDNKMRIQRAVTGQAFFTSIITAAVVLVPTLLIVFKHMSTIAAEVSKIQK